MSPDNISVALPKPNFCDDLGVLIGPCFQKASRSNIADKQIPGDLYLQGMGLINKYVSPRFTSFFKRLADHQSATFYWFMK